MQLMLTDSGSGANDGGLMLTAVDTALTGNEPHANRVDLSRANARQWAWWAESVGLGLTLGLSLMPTVVDSVLTSSAF